MVQPSMIIRQRIAFWRSGWFWVLGFFVTGAIVFLGTVHLYNRWMLERDVDHLYRYVLAEGNAAAAYQHADATFRAMVPWPDFFAVAQDKPHWFERKHLHGVEVVWMMQGDNLYVVMKTRVDDADVDFYCRPAERGNWRLAGIAPGLTAALPKDLKQVSPGKVRR
jgi:hypothetical protein